MKHSITWILTAALFVIACKKEPTTADVPPGSDSNGTPAGTAKDPGYGTSTAPFTSPAWKLPAGVELVDSIHDFTWCGYVSKPPRFEEYKKFKGLPGGPVTMCMTLRNTTNTPVIVDFPEELIIVSSHKKTQNGLLYLLGSVTVPAGAEQFIISAGFCINLSRHAPEPFDEDGNILSYTFGPGQTLPALKEIKELLKPKNISYGSVVKADGSIDGDKVMKASVIQQAVWEVTDHGGLTADTRNKLKDLRL